MKRTLFEVECHTKGHTYIIRVWDSHGPLDLNDSRLVDILYEWSTDDGPLELEDVCDILDSFCGVRDEYELYRTLNGPRFSSGQLGL